MKPYQFCQEAEEVDPGKQEDMINTFENEKKNKKMLYTSYLSTKFHTHTKHQVKL
jgi:hypothetical protein